MAPEVTLCVPQLDDVSTLSRIWHDAWHAAQADLVPVELRLARILPDFERRMTAMLPETRAARLNVSLVGFCTLRSDEVMHLFVSDAAQGTGVARMLLQDAEERLRSNGTERAWLACIKGNMRAAAFYEKSGWTRQGMVQYKAETSTGSFTMEEWRYEKDLTT